MKYSAMPVKVPKELEEEMLFHERHFKESHNTWMACELSKDKSKSLLKARAHKKMRHHEKQLGRIYKKINAYLPTLPGYQNFVDISVDNTLTDK